MSAPAGGAGKLLALLGKDARGLSRDGFLLFLLGYGVVVACVLRLLAPLVPVDGIALYAAPGAPLVGALLTGSALGFALIEERESRTWLLLRVLPIRESALFTYLVGTTTVLALVSGAAGAAVYGRPVVRPWLFAGSLVACALSAPLMMLVLGAFAANKIEGMGVSKIFGTAGSLPVLAFVLPAPWHVLLFWDPWYWIYLGLLRSMASDAELSEVPLALPAVGDAVIVALPAALCLGACLALVRRFQRVAG